MAKQIKVRSGAVRAGVHPMFVAVLGVGLLVAGFWGYLRHSRAQELEIQVATAEAEVRVWKDKESASVAVLKEVVPWFVGSGESADKFFSSDTYQLTGEARQRRQDIMKALHDHYYANLPMDPAEAGGPDWREMLATSGRWILNIVDEQRNRIVEMQDEVSRVKAGREGLEQETREQIRILQEQIQAERAQRGTTVSDLQQQISQRIAERDGYLAQRDTHEGRIRELEQQISRVQEEAQERVNALQLNLGQVTQTLEEMQRQGALVSRPWEETGVDGELVEVVPEREVAYIDLGHQDRVRRGMRFAAFRREKGGMPVWKATLEVVRLHDTWCEARILVSEPDEYEDETHTLHRRFYDNHDPVLSGDYVANPVYQRNKMPRFVLAGVLDMHTQEEAEFLIRSDGGEVQDEVGVDTTFLVIGNVPDENAQEAEFRRYDRSMEMAKRLECEIITERSFNRYLRNYRMSVE
ncbi:MAG: hypothetical protein HY608_00735 [Planctomycetes bacterium]|nr:hypothetical protein [Planctomycetota bacterium]